MLAGVGTIEVEHLHVVRGGRVVLDDVSLTVVQGTVTGMLGPSGSGKTTLLRSIVGVQIVAGGAVSVLDLPAGSPALRTRVAYLTQAPSVYLDLSVHENLAYFARVLDVSARRIDEVLATVDLAAFGPRLVRTLSGGELSRVSLATALLGEPELLILDEPTVGLDPVLRRDLWQTFRALAAGGATLLVSSHVMEEAEHCDRLLLVRDGAIVADETPGSLRERTGCDSLDEAFLTLVEGTESERE
jgi:ABC-2 type transport system ATP-binding protein